MSLLHQDDENELDAPEREVTLSTGALVGIFAGLVLLCGLFFALGYTVRGRQTPSPAVATATPENGPASQANFNTFKPAAGSPVAGAPRPSAETSAERPADAPAASQQPEQQPATADPAPTVPKEAAPLVRPAAPSHPPQPATAVTPVPEGSFIVQVAAVSHPEDAQYVVAALKAKGYPAAARTEPQDKLLHIQVGPYTNRKDAEAMKQRLAADGYNNPIIK
jgi:cell division septation protein DedD